MEYNVTIKINVEADSASNAASTAWEYLQYLFNNDYLTVETINVKGTLTTIELSKSY